MIEAIAVVIN